MNEITVPETSKTTLEAKEIKEEIQIKSLDQHDSTPLPTTNLGLIIGVILVFFVFLFVIQIKRLKAKKAQEDLKAKQNNPKTLDEEEKEHFENYKEALKSFDSEN